MTFPALYTVTHLPAGTPSEDADGNTRDTFGAPQTLAAIAVAPHVTETRTGETYLDTWDLDVFMPKADIDTADRMEVFSVTYEVVKVADWTTGFHGWEPGIVVGLRKWEG